ncbi:MULTISPECIES: histidine-type phosphatase [unclassified Brenneria]|uniref:histidine-type phosphatase n=1 Tax=unclassified Brenneria TaxID=2634434 RepID=UPI0029C5AE82|nr:MULTISPECIES: histidine-type phosphatase [unclassified Brenneria]MDX5630398.1 histidine-type phosphatase [Brenneria sp. L3-3Z]MDX5697543.1 histidine-type phosphatase [Brenneria sp. L4-2C]
MKKSTLKAALTAFCALWWLPAAPALADADDQYRLEKVVMLSRHGVRAQTNSQKLNQATGKQWPQWNVQDGHLSGHGYAGIVNQAGYQITLWRDAGLPLGAGCPSPGQVFAWASPLQRTRATAQALLDGMFPGCGLSAGSTVEKQDPLFQSADMALSKPNGALVRQQILERMGGSEEAVAKRYQPDVERLRQAVCADAACAFLDEPWRLVEKEDRFSLKGPLSAGANIGETIRLQYSEGLPLSQVAFGHAVNARQVAALMALHAAKYDMVSDTPELARHGGTLLMTQLAAALTQGTPLAPAATAQPAALLTLLIGHDTNIAQIQTMLNFKWTLGEYPQNDIPPGGSLVFERYRDTRSGEALVRLSFTAMSLDQWRNLSRFDAAHPLLSADYADDACRKTAIGTLCPLGHMVQVMENSMATGIRAPQAIFH